MRTNLKKFHNLRRAAVTVNFRENLEQRRSLIDYSLLAYDRCWKTHKLVFENIYRKINCSSIFRMAIVKSSLKHEM